MNETPNTETAPRTLIGYARVSTDREEGSREQTLGQQLDKLTEYGVAPSNIYSEKISGKHNLLIGEQWKKLRSRVTPSRRFEIWPIEALDDDTYVPIPQAPEHFEIVLVDWSRLSRDALALQNTVMELKERGCVFTIIGDSRYQQYAPRDAMDGLTLAFEAFGAQMHRERISKSTKSKLDYLKSQGVKLGRPEKLTAADHVVIKELWSDGFGGGRIAKELTRRRIAQIPLEAKVNANDHTAALKHARVSASLIAPILRTLADSKES